MAGALQTLTELVCRVWPEHRAYLDKSIGLRSPGVLETSEILAAAILELVGADGRTYAEDYRWLCAQIQEEELLFARTGAYRYSTFAETSANVYSDAEYMGRYMNGLLLSQTLWLMHAASLHFYRQRVGARAKPNGAVLEVGSGHGLLLFLALRDLGMARAVAWDLSAVSLDQTRHALATLGALDRAEFAVRDLHEGALAEGKFELVILSHLLEHMEEPVRALRSVAEVMAPGGHLFVNVPLNAPMPDHLILLDHPDAALQMMKDGGFNVVDASFHTTQGVSLARAIRSKTAVTCSILAERA